MQLRCMGWMRAWKVFRACWHAEQTPSQISPDTAFQLNTAVAHEQTQSKQLDLLKNCRLHGLPFSACHAAPHPTPKAMTKMQNYAIHSRLASTSCEVQLILCSSILLKSFINNQCERGSRPRSPKCSEAQQAIYQTDQNLKVVDNFIQSNCFPGPATSIKKKEGSKLKVAYEFHKSSSGSYIQIVAPSYILLLRNSKCLTPAANCTHTSLFALVATVSFVIVWWCFPYCCLPLPRLLEDHTHVFLLSLAWVSGPPTISTPQNTQGHG